MNEVIIKGYYFNTMQEFNNYIIKINEYIKTQNVIMEIVEYKPMILKDGRKALSWAQPDTELSICEIVLSPELGQAEVIGLDNFENLPLQIKKVTL
jgi:hypothetical protein